MRADRHPLLRRLRVLLACVAVLWGAGVAVPPGSMAAEAALYSSRTAAELREASPRPARQAIAAATAPATIALPSAAALDSVLPATTLVAGSPDPLYLRHCALLL